VKGTASKDHFNLVVVPQEKL